MGYASSGACFPTQGAALDDWCAHVVSGQNALSCSSCDPLQGSCSLSYLVPGSGVQTLSVPVATPACVEPTPVADGAAYAGAIVALWVVIWAAKQVINLFRVPHADAG